MTMGDANIEFTHDDYTNNLKKATYTAIEDFEAAFPDATIEDLNTTSLENTSTMKEYIVKIEARQ